MRENGFLERPRRRMVQDLVHARDEDVPGLVSVSPTTIVRTALSTLSSRDVSRLPVLPEGECIGSISEERLTGHAIETPALLDRPVEAAMDSPYPVVDGHLDLEEDTRLLTRSNAACLVRENGDLCGIVTGYDVVCALTARRER